MISIGVRFRCVLSDACYSLSAPFLQSLTALKLAFAVLIPLHLKVYPVVVQLIWPVTKVLGLPRKLHLPYSLSTAAEDMLASAQSTTVSSRSGTKVRSKPCLPPSVCVLPTVLPSDIGQGSSIFQWTRLR